MRNDNYADITEEIEHLESIAAEMFTELRNDGTIRSNNSFTHVLLIDLPNIFPERDAVTDVFPINIVANKLLDLMQESGYEIRNIDFIPDRQNGIISSYEFVRMKIIYC